MISLRGPERKASYRHGLPVSKRQGRYLERYPERVGPGIPRRLAALMRFIQRTRHPAPAFIEDMGIDHGGRDIRVPE